MAKIVTLGEIMLRLSTPVGRRTTQSQQFDVHYGGCEANVAVSLANFGHQVFFASKVPKNPVGLAAKYQLATYGVNTAFIKEGGPRLGTYYVESGQGHRAPIVTYDRAGSSFALMDTSEWRAEELFAGVELFHLSGINAALSKEWQEIMLYLVKAARTQGCQISFDINFRSKLWTAKEAGAFLEKMLPLVDYCSAGKLDAQYLLNIPSAATLETDELTYYYQALQAKFPQVKSFYATTRNVLSASHHQLTGHLWLAGQLYSTNLYDIEGIVDRIGGGDAFAAGILHGVVTKNAPQEIVDFATAAAVLKHTVMGDSNLFTCQEVQAFQKNTNGAIQR